jgi:serine/threonine protein kinase
MRVTPLSGPAAEDRGRLCIVRGAGAAGGAARVGPGDVVVGRYLLREPLAARRTVTVWLAHDRLLSRPVVLKHMAAPARGGLRAAVAEARAAAAVSHRNVVAVHDVVADRSGGGWMVMEALDGNTLAAAVARTGGFEPTAVVPIATALVDALAALHGAGVVHRDVKPGNVNLCRDGRVVLLDLGVASGGGTDDPGAPQVVAGTLEYLAPEVVRSGRSAPASDLYALGVTLFCAVEGVVPFRLACVQDLVEHAADPPGPPPSPRAGRLGPLLTGLLQPDPEDRWSVDAVRHHLASSSAPSADPVLVG